MTNDESHVTNWHSPYPAWHTGRPDAKGLATLSAAVSVRSPGHRSAALALVVHPQFVRAADAAAAIGRQVSAHLGSAQRLAATPYHSLADRSSPAHTAQRPGALRHADRPAVGGCRRRPDDC